MSKFEELIERLCPNGVNYTRLQDVCSFKRGEIRKSDMFQTGDIPVIAGGIRPTTFCNVWNRSGETIAISSSGANAGFVSFWSVPVFLTDSFSVHPKSDLLVKYLFYFLKNMQDIISTMKSGGGIPHVYSKDISQILIQIPPLEIQQEIAKILDTFTMLEAELEAELEARKKQYEYYKSLLITNFSEYNTAEMTIGDIYDFQYGTGNTIPTEGGKYPVYGSNGIVGTHSLFNSESSPVIGHIGAYAGIVNWGEGKHFVTYNGVICKHKNDRVIKKYAFYILKAQDYNSKSKNSSQPFISYSTLMEPIVKIPSIEEQQRIVTILDHFDTLVNDLSHGLPAEIAARRKQYEYYRNKLLTFKEVKHESV